MNEQKITAEHLKRRAYLYIRQSTLRQVLEHGESARRQYDLRQRAIGLGWRQEQIITVDGDTAQSAASATGRKDFQQLAAEVGLGHAGLVMGLEVSRLARNCSDWYRLLELCAATDTLILDEEGLYDANQFNDRLLMGLKGAMSEAELHLIKARLQGAILSKARRGELKIHLPPGLVYGPDERVSFDPDQQVQQAVKHFFETFRRTGSACSTVQELRQAGLKFPHRHGGWGALGWEYLKPSRAVALLHNPRYAGAYAYGRSRTRRTPEGPTRTTCVPMEQWCSLIKDAHPAYITWEQYEQNLQQLRNNARAYGAERKQGPAREGSALLQGLVLCGRCGRRMSVRYRQHREQLLPDYICQREYLEQGQPLCQRIAGSGIDKAVGQLILQSLTPLALEVTLNVQQELQDRVAEVDRLRQQQVQRARYEAEQAKTRYLLVDPHNRLVAATLEADWNHKLRGLTEAQEQYEKYRRTDPLKLTDQQRAEVLSLASNFPALWQSPTTTDKDRKRMARLVLEDVTLTRGATVTVQVRFKGGAAQCLNLPLTNGSQGRRIQPELLKEIDQLLDQMNEAQVVQQFNARGCRTALNRPFSLRRLQCLCRHHHLKSRQQRLQDKGLLDARAIAGLLGTKGYYVGYWRQQGLLKGVPLNEKNEFMYELPDQEVVKQIKMRIRCHSTNPDQALS